MNEHIFSSSSVSILILLFKLCFLLFQIYICWDRDPAIIEQYMDNRDWKLFYQLFILVVQIDLLKKYKKLKVTFCLDDRDEKLKNQLLILILPMQQFFRILILYVDLIILHFLFQRRNYWGLEQLQQCSIFYLYMCTIQQLSIYFFRQTLQQCS